MREIRMKIDEVIDVPQVLKKAVKEEYNVDIDSFYQKHIITTEKDLYFYVFEYVYTISYPHGKFVKNIRYVATLTVIASVKQDSTVLSIVLPSDDNRMYKPYSLWMQTSGPSNRKNIITRLKEYGFKIVKIQ